MKKLLIILVLGLFIVGSLGVVAMERLRAYTEPNPVAVRLEDAALDWESLDRHRDLARWYNLNLASADPEPGFAGAYENILDLGEGAMGILCVPSMGIRIPIYHGAEEAREDGAGHLAGTPFPLAADRDHSALRVPFFLEEGDYFYIHCLDTIAAYQVESRELQSGRELAFSGREGDSLCSLIVPIGQTVVRMEGVFTDTAPAEGEIVVRTEENSDGFNLAVCLLLALGIVLVPLMTRWGK